MSSVSVKGFCSRLPLTLKKPKGSGLRSISCGTPSSKGQPTSTGCNSPTKQAEMCPSRKYSGIQSPAKRKLMRLLRNSLQKLKKGVFQSLQFFIYGNHHLNLVLYIFLDEFLLRLKWPYANGTPRLLLAAFLLNIRQHGYRFYPFQDTRYHHDLYQHTG